MYKAPGVGGGALAVTGATYSWWIALAIALIVTGVLLAHAGRRRRRVDS